MSKTTRDIILQNSDSYEEWHVERLKDPRRARGFLEAVFEAYGEDGDVRLVLLALRNITKAQGGIPALAKRTGIGQRRLSGIFGGKESLSFGSLFGILYGLGFRLEPKQDTPRKKRKPLAAQRAPVSPIKEKELVGV